ncbi:MAG: response regulator transcription factor [Acidobacteria bacterium]|nr:response regulator transcription factor [Acidobacteriota bacterium]
MSRSKGGSNAAPPVHPIAVAIVEDRREICEGLAYLIDASPGFRCSGVYPSMEDALKRIPSDVPDVALVDIGLPGMSGIEGIRILKERYPDVLTIVLTIYDDAAKIFEAMCAGACGYLLKKTPPARLVECLREAMEGGSPMTPEVARKVITLFREFRPPERAEYRLTPQEMLLLKLLVEGHSYKTAASEMGVSTPTIAFHTRNIYTKLQVHSKSEAVAKALREHIIG